MLFRTHRKVFSFAGKYAAIVRNGNENDSVDCVRFFMNNDQKYRTTKFHLNLEVRRVEFLNGMNLLNPAHPFQRQIHLFNQFFIINRTIFFRKTVHNLLYDIFMNPFRDFRRQRSVRQTMYQTDFLRGDCVGTHPWKVSWSVFRTFLIEFPSKSRPQRKSNRQKHKTDQTTARRRTAAGYKIAHETRVHLRIIHLVGRIFIFCKRFGRIFPVNFPHKSTSDSCFDFSSGSGSGSFLFFRSNF